MEFKPSDALWERIEKNMPGDSFEPKLQDKLSNYTVEPKEETWEKVAEQLPENKRRFGFIWFTSAVLLAFLGLGISYTLIQDSSKQSTTLATQASFSEAENQTGTQQPEINLNATTADAPSQGSIQTNNKSKESLAIIGKSDNANAEEENSFREKPASNQGILNKPIYKPIVNQNKPEEASQKKPVKMTNQAKGKGKQGPLAVGVNPSENNHNEPPLPPATAQASPSQAPNQAGVPLARTESPKTGNKQAIEIPATDPISPTTKTDSNAQSAINRNEYMETDGALTQFAVIAMMGSHMSFMQLSKPEGNAYELSKTLELRQEIETPEMDFSGSLQLEYNLGKRWFVRAGVGIVSFKQSVHYDLTQPDTVPVKMQDAGLYRHPADSVIVGTTFSLENKYSFTEFPVLVGYKALNNESWSLDVIAGVSYGKLNLVNVYMPDPSCIGLLMASDKDAFPKFKNVWFGNFSTSVNWHVNTTVSVGFMPHVRVGLNNMVDNADWIGQRPISTGANLILRKRF